MGKGIREISQKTQTTVRKSKFFLQFQSRVLVETIFKKIMTEIFFKTGNNTNPTIQKHTKLRGIKFTLRHIMTELQKTKGKEEDARSTSEK